jgi:O-antigen/teichoic acid export membrane protein
MLYVFCLTNVPARPIPYIIPSKIRALLGYGGWVALMGLINPILTVFDRFFIGAIAGMAAVAAYTIPYNLVLRIGALPSALQNALFPRFSMAEEEKGLALLLIVVRGTAALLTPLLVIGMVLVKPFLTLWLGHKLAGETSSVGQILIVGLWAYTAVFIPSAYLQARKRPDVEPKFGICELIAYGPLLYWLTSRFGANGAAWAWDARALVHTILILWAIGILTTAVKIWVGLVLVFITWGWVFMHTAPGMEYWLANLLLVAASMLWSFRVMPIEVSTAVAARLRKARRPPAAAGSKLS